MADTTAPSPVADAVRGCLDVCDRCERLAATVATASRPAYAAVGPHLRHCVDHFTAFLRDLSGGAVDYDSRDRDPALEADPAQLAAALDGIRSRLAAIAGTALAAPLEVIQLAAPGARPHAVASTVERELLFLSSHTIHHLALMIQLAAAHGVVVPEDLGVAFSTAAYREASAAASG